MTPDYPVPLSWYRRFHRATSALAQCGWFVAENFWPADWLQNLRAAMGDPLARQGYQAAGLGRGAGRQIDADYRNDTIRWLDGADPVEARYLALMQAYRQLLNRRLFLGVADYECHFASYPAGGFYRRHVDGFRDLRARVVTTITYLNADWQAVDGGELLLYAPQEPQQILARVAPCAGTFVTFLSEDFPHEVLPAARRRDSLTGWFRVRPLA